MIQAPPPDDKKETYEYIAVAHRINQDVWHDNFVPKYSAIASAKPSWLFLIGIWILFAPQVLFSLIVLIETYPWRMTETSLYTFGSFSLLSLLFATLLFVQTRRFIQSRPEARNAAEPDPGSVEQDVD